MDSLDEIGVAREGLQRGGLIPTEERRDRVLLHVQHGEVEPRECVFEVSPDALNRVQLGTVGRQADQAHVGWAREPLGGMRATIVQHQEIEAVRKGRREGIDDDLEAFRVQIWPFEEGPVAGGQLHRTIDVEPCADMWHAPDGLHAARGDVPTADGQSADAAFVLAKHPDGGAFAAGSAGWRCSRHVAWRRESPQDFLVGVGRATFSLALKRVCTRV
jgi:hypothetical protein